MSIDDYFAVEEYQLNREVRGIAETLRYCHSVIDSSSKDFSLKKNLCELISRNKTEITELENKNKQIEKDIVFLEKYKNLLEKYREVFEMIESVNFQSDIVGKVLELEKISEELLLNQQFELIKERIIYSITTLFSYHINIDTKSIIVKDLDVFKEFIKLLSYLKITNNYILYLFNCIYSFIDEIALTNSDFVEVNNDKEIILKMTKRKEQHSLCSCLNQLEKLYMFIASKLDYPGLEIDSTLKQLFCEKSLYIAFSFSGGFEAANKDAIDSIIKITGAKIHDITSFTNKHQISEFLVYTRDKFKSGGTFGSIINDYKDRFSTDIYQGLLKHICLIALVVWNEDRNKINSAINVLTSIDSLESLECIYFFYKFL